jgi:uncharacterized damage-inducible protein DinB
MIETATTWNRVDNKGEDMRIKMMSIVSVMLLAVIFVPAAYVSAEEGSQDPKAASHARTLTAASGDMYEVVQKILLASAQRMPEERYGFKPADGVRSFGQILGRVADSQYYFCSSVLEEVNPAPRVEKNKTSKAELIEALENAFSYCTRAHAILSDASATEMVNFMGGDKPKLHVLTINQVHTIEHYGNLVTYMRMNEIVPPTSDSEFMKQLGR